MTTPRRRLGMLAPSSNTVLEPATWKLLPADGSVTAHVSRLRVVQISGEQDSLGQFALDRVVDAASLLADAAVDLILWNGTAASWLGFDRDRALVAAVEQQTGTRTTTAVIAINAELERFGAKRIGLVTPYVEALEAAIAANYASIGVDIIAASRLDLTRNTDYAAVGPDTLRTMVRAVAESKPDAIAIMCTNLAGSDLAEPLSLELGIPVLDSVRVAVAHALEMMALPNHGLHKRA